jgi:murein DD-endopeptidase MepM/ murein hydrolase activator NlpD
MNSDRFLFILLLTLSSMLGLPVSLAQNSDSPCPAPVISRLKPHRIIAGETPASIAFQYNLLPETLIRLNPILKKNPLPVGQIVQIPPFNGVFIPVPTGATWKDLEEAYGIRADILFELNGCTKVPKQVFIPGTNWSNPKPNAPQYLGLGRYPLPSRASVGLKYGWQDSPINQQRLFHSGVDLLAPLGTEVLAAEGGTIAFVGQENAYGILIIINHSDTYQTRYAHLSRVRVQIGQKVTTGEVIGEVGTTGQPDINEPHLHFEVRNKLPIGWVAQDPLLHFSPAP